MSCKLREDGTSVSSEGGDAAGSGLPGLLHRIETQLGDRARPAAARGDEIRRLCVEYMTAPDGSRGEISAATESFCRAITGKGKSATARLAEGNPRMEKLLEAEKALDRIGKRFCGVAKNGRDFFKRITNK